MTKTTKNPKGAGRKKGKQIVPDHLKQKSRTINMDDARWSKFHELGGNAWLRGVVDSIQI